MEHIGTILFSNIEDKATFQSLENHEILELQKDLGKLFSDVKIKMDESKFYDAHAFANQRINDRYFRVEVWLDLNPEREKSILFNKFQEVDLNQYLDNINNDKSL